MFIKFLEVENWKCFKKKKRFEFKQHELIKMRNGSGKTSIFEAVLYAIWGKAPVGFNLNTVRNDDSKACRVFISFDLRNNGILEEVTIERIFGNNSPLSELRIEGNLVCESVRSIEDYMNKIINQKITTQLWTTSLSDSDITSNNFFTKSVLNDILEDPLKLVLIYKSRIYNGNKKINSFDQNVLDVDVITDSLNSIKSNLKEKSNDIDISIAKAAEAAESKIKALSEKIKNPPTLEDAKRYMTLYRNKDRIVEELKNEKKKKENEFSNLNEREVKKILDISLKTGHCILCGGEFDEGHRSLILKELSLAGRSNEKIQKLSEELMLLQNNKEIVEAVIDLDSQKRILEKCLNHKQIIESYNEENNKLWEEFEDLQKQQALALKQQEELKAINELKLVVQEDKEKLQVLNSYVEEASVYYTNQIMDKASQYISSINSRYKQICLYENSFYVVLDDIDFTLKMLPIVRLSKGEKTIVALSLLFAIHNILVPELPLLFDETFSALDQENLEQIQRFLRTQQTQIFVITHDKNWNEF